MLGRRWRWPSSRPPRARTWRRCAASSSNSCRRKAPAWPGQASVEVGAIDPRMSLAACPAPQAFQQPGARAWGKTTVGVRCAAPTAWTVYIQAKVTVQGEYVAAAVPLAQGQPIEQSQLVLMKGDLSAMPNGVVTDMAQAIGRSSTVSLPSGAPLRLDALQKQAGGAAGPTGAGGVVRRRIQGFGRSARDRHRRRRPGGAGAHAGRRHHQRRGKNGRPGRSGFLNNSLKTH